MVNAYGDPPGRITVSHRCAHDRPAADDMHSDAPRPHPARSERQTAIRPGCPTLWSSSR
ncbi:hypothetical protein ACH41H_43325 [Streptomyces sp. NPDC020800]|uniref:hypothetical protein n=1 Tax=Streptomyces sp. NPDC020800 TaxID=3365092 RepID=UPI003798BF35